MLRPSDPLAVLSAAALLALPLPADPGPRPQEAPTAQEPVRRSTAIELNAGEPFEAIRQAEYERSSQPLVELARDDDPRVRARVALALGRISDLAWPRSSALSHLSSARVLRQLVGDEDVRVRRAAVFAFGVNGHPYGGDALFVLLGNPEAPEADPIVRALAVESLSKLERPDLHTLVLKALEDEDARVRGAAAVGTHRWSPDAEDAAEVDRALTAALGDEGDAGVRWRILFALQRRGAAVQDAYLEGSRDEDPLSRLFAARGLARLAPAEPVRARLEELRRDEDWRVAYEAILGLGAYGSTDLWSDQDAISPAATPLPHLRRAVWLALTQRPVESWDWTDERPSAAAALDDPSPAVTAAGLEAVLRLYAHAPPGLEVDVESLLESETVRALGAVELAGLARGIGHFPEPRALPLLHELAHRADPRVAGAALEALGRFPGEDARAILRELLAAEDDGLRLAAALSLREMATEEDLEALRDAWETTETELALEVRYELLRAAARTGEPGRSFVEPALSHIHPHVRRVAVEAWEALPPPRQAPALAEPPPVEAPRAPQPGRDFPAWERNPWVALDTTRGTLVFELLPEEAPVHVHNFLELAREGHYVGRTFHRVVPDFVIQGGDYRGDGNGAVTWNGHPLPLEVAPRGFVRGSLGMPRNEWRDSGGSQIFVTHRPTPHLDGRYTIFGELREGFDALDRIDVDDRILAVRELPVE